MTVIGAYRFFHDFIVFSVQGACVAANSSHWRDDCWDKMRGFDNSQTSQAGLAAAMARLWRAFSSVLQVSGKSVLLVYLLLWAIVSAPLLMTDIPPMLDYPNHISRIHILTHLDDPAYAEIYRSNWKFLPNLMFEAVAIPLSHLMPVKLAGKVYVALYLLALPLGVLFLHFAIYRRLSLLPALSFLFVYHEAFMYGFLGFCLSLALAFAAVAIWILIRAAPLWARFLIGALMSAILVTSHLYALGVYGLAVGVIELYRFLTKKPRTQASIQHFAVSALQFVPTLGAFSLLYLGGGSFSGEFGFPTLGVKMQNVSNVINARNGVYNALPFLPLSALAAIYAVRRVSFAPLMWVICLLVFVEFYLAMPGRFMGVFYADWRILIVAMFLLAAIMNPSVLTRNINAALACCLVVVAGMNAILLKRDWRDGEQTAQAAIDCTKGVLQAGDSMRAMFWGNTVYVGQDKGLWHIPTLAVIDEAIFIPTLFADETQQPLAFTPAYQEIDRRDLKYTIQHPRKLDWPVVIKDYDYALVTDLREEDAVDFDDWTPFLPEGVERVCTNHRVALYRLPEAVSR